MATNRKRTKRIPKSKIPAKISAVYRKKLTLKDFQGMLEPQEIPVAARAGVLRWNLWKKAGNITELTFEQHQKGFRLAPVFAADGKVDLSRYPKKVKFLVNNYQELEAK
jgi:hypothetical protein